VVPVPLVIHGTSGIHDADLAALARMRVAKFNIGTVLRQAFGAGLREALASDPDLIDRTEIMRQAMPPVTAAATRMIRLLGWRSLAE
jgi:fructose-bisphosphate aldolase class II